MRILCACALLTGLTASPLAAQFFYPSSASRRLNFVQLADGGPSGQNWTTTIAVANPDPANLAEIHFTFYDNKGQGLPLDFGQGASSTLILQVPAGGSRLVTSTGASSDITIGWARGLSNLPVYGTVIYRARANGTPLWDVAAAGVGGTFFYGSQATYMLGVALANPSGTDTIHLRVSATYPNGTAGGVFDQSLPPNGHAAFNLGVVIPSLPRDFTGTVGIISTDSPPATFSAWTMYERDGMLSPLPPGGMQFPPVTIRKTWDAMGLMQAGAAALARTLGTALFNASPATVSQYVMQEDLDIQERGSLGASYESATNIIHLTRGLVEVLDGSDAALAFLVGHYVARGILNRTGVPSLGVAAMPSTSLACDTASVATLFNAGLDPYGVADFFGRLTTASMQGLTFESSLQAEFGDVGQYADRSTQVWSKVVQECKGTTAFAQVCQQVRGYWCPDCPPISQ